MRISLLLTRYILSTIGLFPLVQCANNQQISDEVEVLQGKFNDIESSRKVEKTEINDRFDKMTRAIEQLNRVTQGIQDDDRSNNESASLPEYVAGHFGNNNVRQSAILETLETLLPVVRSVAEKVSGKDEETLKKINECLGKCMRAQRTLNNEKMHGTMPPPPEVINNGSQQ